jgi:hypothetical protein
MIPSKLRIGPIEYDVVDTPGTELGENIFGQVDHIDCVIRIRKDLDEQQRFMTLVHEALHVVMWLAGFPGGGPGIIRVEAESLAERLTPFLCSLMKDNALLVEK